MFLYRLKTIRTKHYNVKTMEVEEHFYQDNSRLGPEDAWTTLPGVNYYFLGNGFIQAAVQVCSQGSGTPVGLLVMDPERFGPKRRALSFDPESGLRQTMATLETKEGAHSPHAADVKARWFQKEGVPAAKVTWRGRAFVVSESFFCPDRRRPRIIRQIRIRNLGEKKLKAVLRTGAPDQEIIHQLNLAAGKEKNLFLEYKLSKKKGLRRVKVARCDAPLISKEARLYWQQAARIHFPSALFDHFYESCIFELQANIAASGKLDGSIWQYNREWTRDQAMVSIGLTLSGQFELARKLLSRLLRQFITEAGDTIDSSERRPPQECELDQNGALLFALETYVLWTDDGELVSKYWKKIEAAARFPLKKVFRHPSSGLLHNRREFWERHAAHGIEDGMELAHQLWVSIGLSSASRLALLLKKEKEAKNWEKAAQKIRSAMLADKKFRLIQNNSFIKRRKITGEIQAEVKPVPSSGLPASTPLFEKGRHYLNPDTSTALPIAWGFIPPRSKLAWRTLAQLEKLWNQRWRGGGYGRYHVSSEPDSPGPWPFASLFLARAYFEAGDNAKVWRILRWLGRAPGSEAGSWFEFYGPRPIPPYPQIGIVPWTWVELLILFIHHLLGVRPEWPSLLLRPRLLRGLPGFKASLRLRGFRLNLVVKKANRKDKPGFLVNGKFFPYAEEGFRLPYPQKDLRLKAWIPSALRKIKN
jgi:hypothetical protein